MGQYLPLVALLVLTALFGGISIVVSRLLNPPRPTPAKVAPYECGIVDQTPPPERFPVRFYLIAMIFIVFDIEIIFLYPFAMIFRELGGFGLGVIVIFSIGVFESFLYLIANGALDWGPGQATPSRQPRRPGAHRAIDRPSCRSRGPRPRDDHLDADHRDAEPRRGGLTWA